MNVAASLARKIRLTLGLAIVKLTDDARKLQQMQVTLLKDEVRDKVTRFQDYGFTSHPLAGAECLAASVGGNRSHLVIVRCDDGRHRKRNLAEGEVAVYHHEGGYILLKNGKEIDVVMPDGKVNVTAPEVTVTASTKVTLDTPETQLTGNLQVDGSIACDGTVDADGNITSGATVQGAAVQTAAGIDLGSHTHTSASPGSPTSPPL